MVTLPNRGGRDGVESLMTTIYPALIHQALATVRYPGNGKSIMENEMLEDDLRIDGMKVSFSLIFPKPTDPFRKSVIKAAEAAIKMYVDKDMRDIYEMKSHMSADRFALYKKLLEEMYRAEQGGNEQ